MTDRVSRKEQARGPMHSERERAVHRGKLARSRELGEARDRPNVLPAEPAPVERPGVLRPWIIASSALSERAVDGLHYTWRPPRRKARHRQRRALRMRMGMTIGARSRVGRGTAWLTRHRQSARFTGLR